MDLVEDIRSVTYLLIDVSIAFVVLTLGVLIFIFFYLYFFKSVSHNNRKLSNQFYNLVGEVSLCESEGEREAVFQQPYVLEIQQTYLRHKRRRLFMRKALVQFHKTIHGAAAANTGWLYEKLGFKRDTLEQLGSHRWHKKAAAVQELAEMGQQECIAKIYRYTNHRNYYIRSSAQVAVVKLTGFEGLRFLNVIDQPITQWQQLCLLQQLATYSNIQQEKLKEWLTSSNESVVGLALKLVKAYAVHNVYDQLVVCLQHKSVTIRTEAIETLTMLAATGAVPILKTHYKNAEQVERIAIVKCLQAMGTNEDIPFLTELLSTSDKLLHRQVVQTLHELAPGYDSYLLTNITTANQLKREITV